MNNNEYLTTVYINANSQSDVKNTSQQNSNDPIYTNCEQLVASDRTQHLNYKTRYISNKFNSNSFDDLFLDDRNSNQSLDDQKYKIRRIPPPIRPRTSILKKFSTKQKNSLNSSQILNNHNFTNKIQLLDRSSEEHVYNDINLTNGNDYYSYSNNDDDYYDQPIKHYDPPNFPPPLPPRKFISFDNSMCINSSNDNNDTMHERNLKLKFEDNFKPSFDKDDCYVESVYGKIKKKSNSDDVDSTLFLVKTSNASNHSNNQSKRNSISSLKNVFCREIKTELNNNVSRSSSNLSSYSEKKNCKKKLTKPMIEMLSPLINSLSKNSLSLDRKTKNSTWSSSNQDFKSSLTSIDLISHSENDDLTKIPNELKEYTSKSITKQSALLDCNLYETEIAEPAKDKTGFLFKAGTSRKQFNRRWCILKQNAFYYFNEQIKLINSDIKIKNIPNGCIELDNVLFVGKIINNTYLSSNRLQKAIKTIKSIQSPNKLELFQFNIGTSIENGRLYLFASETEAHRKLWISSFAFKIKPKLKPSKIVYSKLDACGYLNIKIGITGLWTKCWTALKQRELYILILDIDTTSDNENIDLIVVDLRKTMIVGFNSNSQISNCETVYEDGPIFFLNRRYENALYFQADYKSHTEEWLNLIESNWNLPENGVLEDQLLAPNNTPIAVEKCLNFVSTYGNKTPLIYINHGKESSVKIIFDNLKSNTLFNWHIKPEDGFTVFDVADALKIYLTSFPECILTEQLYPDFNKLYLITDHNKRIDQLKTLLKKLPDVNFSTLKKLICHFNLILEKPNENQLKIDKLASVISPIILFSKISAKPDSKNAINLFKDLISSFVWLFDVKAEEIEKEHKIQTTLNEISNKKIENKQNNSEFLISVYIYNKKWGRCLNVPINSTMTADDLIFYASRIANLKEKPTKLAVYEVISNDQLERVLHYSEIILNITLGWTTNWDQKDAKENYLLIKVNNFYDKLDFYLNHNANKSISIPFTLFNEVRFSDLNQGKNFKKVILELIATKFNVYKDAKANRSLSDWLIEDVVWYLGSELKRNAPTKFCITFLERYQPVLRTKESHACIGKVIAFNTEEELNKWIAGLINAEYPNGIYPLIHSINLF